MQHTHTNIIHHFLFMHILLYDTIKTIKLKVHDEDTPYDKITHIGSFHSNFQVRQKHKRETYLDLE